MVELGTRNHFGGGISLTVRVNGITLRYAECEAKTSLSTVARDAPLILFLHGWPEIVVQLEIAAPCVVSDRLSLRCT